ncbi:MAG: HAD family hydrolase, partial [Oscillospiraceae bacterium]|nr:HAD family hydrolase [Oscillospiraceae bacterium]
IVRDKYAHDIGLLDGAEEMLRTLRRAGIPVCVATANSRELTMSVLSANSIDGLIDHVVTTDDTGSTKSDPLIFRRCAELMGTSPELTAVVEDSPHSAKTAMDDGFYTIGTDSRHYGDYEQMRSCADMCVRDLNVLMDKLNIATGYAVTR